ncbi:MAG: hypothetical protein HC915_12915 [Anaerolineae bacterium]|nr:hypothetical protein [Anaerolineae bacterium]
MLGIALGTAAYLGVRTARDLRQEFERELRRLREIETLYADIQAVRAENQQMKKLLEEYRPLLQSAVQQSQEFDQQMRAAVQRIDEAVETTQQNSNDLLQANDELNLKNYDEAYRLARRVHGRSPENVQALYLMGWLETQYMPDQLEAGIEKLRQAMTLAEENPLFKAAYGTALRRQASHQRGKAQRDLLQQAEGYLRVALGENDYLLDLNRESYWGPVGSILRDRENLGGAIEAYQAAQKVTPSSSYPAINLALLYLQQARAKDGKTGQRKFRDALEAFERVVACAKAELYFIPKDYYPIMDMAQAEAILGLEDKSRLRESQKWLESAIEIAKEQRSGGEVLRAAQRAWEHLRAYLPEADAEPVRAHVENAIQRLLAAQDAVEAAAKGG